MHLILVGATGLVGSGVLHNMLTNNSVTAISILSRRPVPMAKGHPKANVILHADFRTYPTNVLDQLKGASGCVWALGVSQNDVSKDIYEEITVDYPIAAGRAFSSLASAFKFVYVSGEGATLSPGIFTPYFGKIKGHAESELLKLSTLQEYSSLKPYSLRPGAVDPKQHQEIHEWIPKGKGFKAVVSPPLLAVVRTVGPSMVSPTRDLGRVLVELAMGDGERLDGVGVSGEGRTISNTGMRRLAGL
ncbi:MAG: hypothetical protein LQ342_008189 [Letrouitia transgressa]|nr:MAG: hypothetical protein LQ342_008189 [Letrouitia transgressa]